MEEWDKLIHIHVPCNSMEWLLFIAVSLIHDAEVCARVICMISWKVLRTMQRFNSFCISATIYHKPYDDILCRHSRENVKHKGFDQGHIYELTKENLR